MKGQALVSLLVFMIIALVITSGAVVLVISNSINSSKLSLGNDAFTIAEAGVENALVRLLRDESYTGETLALYDGQAVVTVTGSNPYTIHSVGQQGNYKRTVEVVVEFVNNEMTVTSWEEVY